MAKRGIIIGLLVLVAWGFFLWFAVFRSTGRYQLEDAVPADAVFIGEIPSFNRVHESIHKTRIWQSVKDYPYFEPYHENLEKIDSLCDAYPFLKRALTDRRFVLSYHPVSATEYDLLYVCDLGKLNVIQRFENEITGITTDSVTVKRGAGGEGIHELNWYGSRYYFAFEANLLMASENPGLLGRARRHLHKGKQVQREIKGGDMALTFNHRLMSGMFNRLTKQPVFSEGDPLFDETRLMLRMMKDHLLFTGQTYSGESSHPLWEMINSMEGEMPQVSQVAGQQTAAYLSFCFPLFRDLQMTLTDYYRDEYPDDYKVIDGYLQRMNKWLGIDVLQLFTSWIGQEIAFIKPSVPGENRLDHVILAIRSHDITYAEEQLGYLSEQISRKTPVREKEFSYNGYSIRYFSLKGFFNLFFNELFNTWDRPYYTFIGDYVVFSNNPESLVTMIREYSLKKTLEYDETHRKWMEKLGGKVNLCGYVRTPETYRLLYHLLKQDSRQELENNRDLVMGFEAVAFTLLKENKGFKTRLLLPFSEQAYPDFEKREIRTDYEKQADLIESGYYYPVIPESIQVSTHDYYTYKAHDFTARGSLSEGNPDGIWKIETYSGKTIGQLPYKKGELRGDAQFFYESGVLRSRATYHNNQLAGYKEYFQDGTLKMEITYKKGERHGMAKYYYPSGHLYAEGTYKNGKRMKWQHYRITGEKMH